MQERVTAASTGTGIKRSEGAGKRRSLSEVKRLVTLENNNLAYKLRPSDYRYIEKMLYEQKTQESAICELEAELEEILGDLFPGGSGSYVDMTTAKGQPEFTQPEAWVIKREENLRVKDLRQEITRRKRHQAVVGEAMKYMDAAESQLVFLRYYEEKSHNYIARKLNMWDMKERQPLRTYWRTRRKVLEKIAKFAGLI